eukprot:9123466-Ditylum_brightwellii.AAC.1
MCNSGASASIVRKKYCTSISKYRCKHTTWATSGGEFETWCKARLKFQLPEFSTSKENSWSFHVDKPNPNNDTLVYDMIIGRDLMSDLGIIIVFEDGYCLKYYVGTGRIIVMHIERSMALPKGTLLNGTQMLRKMFYRLNCELFGSPWFVGGLFRFILEVTT